MNVFGQMNEIVGESGTPGKPGCAMTMAYGLAGFVAAFFLVAAVWLMLA